MNSNGDIRPAEATLGMWFTECCESDLAEITADDLDEVHNSQGSPWEYRVWRTEVEARTALQNGDS